MSLLPFLDIINSVISRVIPDPKDRIDLEVKMAALADQESAREHEENMGQLEVNKIEAANPSLFVAGWRPAVGWGCGAALVYNTLIAPMFHLGIADIGFLQTILLAMLGMGTMRSYEKAKGVETQAIGNPTTKPSITMATPVKKGLLPFHIPGLF